MRPSAALVAALVILAPAALAQQELRVTDPPGDVRLEGGSFAQDDPTGAHPHADILEARLTVEERHLVAAVTLAEYEGATSVLPDDVISVGDVIRIGLRVDDVDYEVRPMGTCGAILQRIIAGRTHYVACVETVNDPGLKQWGGRIPLELLAAGASARGAWEVSLQGVTVSRFVAPAVPTSIEAVDRLPEGFNESLRIVPAAVQIGAVAAQPTPSILFSNGGAETNVFGVYLEAAKDAVVGFTVASKPPAWRVYAPETVHIAADTNRWIPMLVETSGAHAHGSAAAVRLDVFAAGARGEVELTTQYLEVPQPTGHHPVLYAHVADRDGVQGWLSTEDDDETRQQPIPPRQTEFTSATWDLSLDPSLAVGLDFRPGYLASGATRLIEARTPITPQSLDVQLFYCDPATTESDHASSGSCAGGLVLLGETSVDAPSTQMPVTFEWEFPIDEWADHIPPQVGGNLLLRLRFWHEEPTSDNQLRRTTSPQLDPAGTSLVLPLDEYRALDAFQANTPIELTPSWTGEIRLPPGSRTTYNLTIENHGPHAFHGHISPVGVNAAWLPRWDPQELTIDAGSLAKVVLELNVPEDAALGSYADLILAAADEDDVLVGVHSMVVRAIEGDALLQDGIQTQESKESPAPAIVLIAFAFLGAVAGRRRTV